MGLLLRSYWDSGLGSFYRRTRMKTFFKRCHRKCHYFQWEYMYRVYHSHKSAKTQGRTDLSLGPQNTKYSCLWWEGARVTHKKRRNAWLKYLYRNCSKYLFPKMCSKLILLCEETSKKQTSKKKAKLSRNSVKFSVFWSLLESSSATGTMQNLHIS